MKYTKVLPALVLLLSTLQLAAQEAQEPAEAAESPSWMAQVNVVHQDLAVRIVYGQLATVYHVPIRPFYSLDLQHNLKKSELGQFFVSGQLGFYNNLYHERWISGKIGFGREGSFLTKGFYTIRVEGGLARAKSSDVQYALEDGKWVPTENFAKPSVDILMGPRLDIGYPLLNKTHRLDLVLTSQLLLHIDTSIESGLPLYGIGAGLRYHFH